MFIRSQNLFLRPAWPEDWPAILGAVGDEAVARNLGAVPWPYGEAEARWFASQPQDQHYPHFLITLPTGRGGDQPGGVLVGCIGLTPPQGADADGAAQFGYWIARGHWNRGYATEAGRALLGLAPVLGHGQLVANCFRDNPASARVLRKLGFHPTGKIAMLTAPARGHPAPAAGFAIDVRRHNNGEAAGGMEDEGDAGAMIGRNGSLRAA